MADGQTNVVILNEATRPSANMEQDTWTLCFQYCRYEYGDGTENENGYRFIWRRSDGSLQAARGQARIPSLADIHFLTAIALEEGWGHHKN
jgi:hypothetical protein